MIKDHKKKEFTLTTRLVLINEAIFGESLDNIILSFILLFLLLTFSLLANSTKAVDSFDSPPPLATLEPRLAYGLGVVEFPIFLFLGIGSLFEYRSIAGSLACIRPPIGGAVRTPPSCNRASKTCVL